MATIKKVFVVLISLFLISVLSNADVSKQVLSEREQFAAEVVSSDEDFLMDYIDELPEDRLMWFFEKAIDMAIEAAKETVKIESDDEAYQIIVEKINGEDGVKAKVVKMVEDYLYRVPGMGSRSTSLASARIENFDLIGDSFMNHLSKIENNINKVKVQKSLF